MVKKAKNAVVWQRIGGLALGIAVLVYAVYHVSSLFGEDISTINISCGNILCSTGKIVKCY